MSNRRNLLALGLHGISEGTCVGCMKATDTALRFRGSPEWLIAGLTALAVPCDVAITMVAHDPGITRRPDGRYDLSVQVCAACVRESGTSFPAPAVVVIGAELPTIAQAPGLQP